LSIFVQLRIANINSVPDTHAFHEFIFEVTTIKIVINKYA
jgi:hypothetical protein